MKISELQEVCEVIAGQSPPSDTYNKNKVGIPFFQGKADFGELFPTVRYWCSKPTKISIPNDILFSVRAPVGPTNINNTEACIGRGLSALRCKDNKIIMKFLLHFLRANEDKISNLGTGSTFKAITISELKKLQIPLPPLPQQKKIAAILDSADTYRQKTKALIAKYDELTQSLFLDMFGDPVKNEKGWEFLELKKCTTKIGSGSTPRGGKESYKDSGISLIRSMNIYDNQFKYENLAFISDEQADKLKNVTVERNDVLFNITGASVCRCSVVPENVLPARVNQHVSILRAKTNLILPKFLMHVLISENVKRNLLKVGSAGGAIMEAITKEQLEKYEIPMPSLILQTQFAERVQAIEIQKEQAQASLEKAEELFNSLLQRAFKGELV
jgi:type I restriction enzyme S subunit